MVTISNANKALKTFYLGFLADQLNVGVNPFPAKIGPPTADVWGKEIKKLAPYGINGGIGSGAETDPLPASGGNNYAQFTLTLKNLFGKIEISDKAVRASQNSAGAFVNLLNAEMDGLLKAGKFNFGRMLYGDGSGLIATTVTNASSSPDTLTVDSVKALMEGMTVDVYNASGNKDAALSGARILVIDRDAKTVRLSAAASAAVGAGYKLYVQGSKDNELTGLEAVFGDSEQIYGLNRADYSFLTPYVNAVDGKATPAAIQSAIDVIEEVSGGTVDFIVCSFDVRRQYVDFLSANRTNLDYMNLDGGYKALSYAGVPLVADRFVADGTMYLLNSADFKLHQLCDWRWLEGEGGTVLHQIPGKASYSATLVKYADLLCERPMGQAKLTFTGKEPVSSDVVLHTVTLNSMCSEGVSTQTVIDGDCATEPKDPYNAGYAFDGWQLDGEDYDFSTPVTSDITLVATYI